MLRPGQSLSIGFPLVQSAEIDGTVRIHDIQKETTSDASNVLVELIDSANSVVQAVRTSYDGFYLFDQVKPGGYQVRISPDQLIRLKLESPDIHDVALSGNGDIRSGMDFLLIARE